MLWAFRSWGIRAAIALTVAGVNLLLKGGLSWLVALERRWTRTSLERSYALLCYLAMLVNSVVVVLLVRDVWVGGVPARRRA